MNEQAKLEDWQIGYVRDVVEAVRRMDWSQTPQGFAFWSDAWHSLSDIVTHGTSDGKPYVEPIRIPTDEDAKQRPMVMVRDLDIAAWGGPVKLVYVRNGDSRKFVVIGGDDNVLSYKYCRFPTEAESKEMGQ